MAIFHQDFFFSLDGLNIIVHSVVLLSKECNIQRDFFLHWASVWEQKTDCYLAMFDRTQKLCHDEQTHAFQGVLKKSILLQRSVQRAESEPEQEETESFW